MTELEAWLRTLAEEEAAITEAAQELRRAKAELEMRQARAQILRDAIRTLRDAGAK